jgi:DNA-directed RNA polymerase specialized sigma subunit
LNKEYLLGITRFDSWQRTWNEELAEIACRRMFVSGMTDNNKAITALSIWEANIQAQIDKQATYHKERIEAVEAIPDERDRTLIRLYYVEGHTWEEVAEIMGYTPQWIHSLHKQFWKKEGEKNESQYKSYQGKSMDCKF